MQAVEHPMLEAFSTSDLSRSENWQWLVIKGVEILFWWSLFSLNWWNYFKYFTGMIFTYNLGIMYYWYQFVNTAGATATFIDLYNFDKWFHVPFWTFANFLIFSVLEIADYYE